MPDRTPKIQLYKDSADKDRWRLRDPENGKILDAATEGFHDHPEAIDNCERIKEAFSHPLEFEDVAE